MAWNTGYVLDPEAEVLEGDHFPRVYLNNGHGDLVFTPINGADEIEFLEHRVHPEFGTGIRSELKEVNGDGIGDLIKYDFDIPLGADVRDYPKLIISYGIDPQKVAGP